jgi:putative CocE/NonD family hydrolase
MAKLEVPSVPLRVEHNAPIQMRDGTLLRADIYRPVKGGPFPVLLIRTPYGEPMLRQAPFLPAIDAGFAVVAQHCRGCGTSDGEFSPFVDEAGDGVDTIEWCARQPWSNGAVGMYGPSYLGMVQLAAAASATPAVREALKGLVMIVTPADYHWGLAYRQGAFQLGQLLGWHLLKTAQELGYRAASGEDVSGDMAALGRLMADPSSGYGHLPLRDAPAVSGVLPSWRDWVEHEEAGDYWNGLSYKNTRNRVEAPALHVGGWFDLFLGGTLDNYMTLSREAASEQARRGQRLIVGPWTHGDRSGTVGELHFGAAASEQGVRLEQTQLDFLRRTVQSEPREPAGPPVKLFVMGDNIWRNENEWPLARTRWTPWYLHADGSLSRKEPDESGPSRFSFDPRDPVPTVGGATFLAGGPGGVAWAAGPRVQRAVGADTDFTAKLVDVWPDGRALIVVDGIVRARYRDGTGRPSPITPGEVNEYTIDLIATSQVFKAGHRLRVDIASSSFPQFDRNPGNGAPSATATEEDFVVQHQSVYHDGARPSHITLPVIPR